MLDGRYRIVGLLGRGGMGEVYRADDLTLGQPVALKFLPRELERDAGRLARFLNEVKLARQVSHPNVCRVYDVGETDEQHYLSMEYVDGEDLASLLRRVGRLPPDRAVRMARQLCAGLAAAHEQGILHRDLKPGNVMVDGTGRAKITDFGLASLVDTVEGAELRVGTPGYMAPEQLAGKEVTPRSDLYSLGLVLYELFTGERAFSAPSQVELVRMQQESAPTSPTSHVDTLDPAVERVILRCLEKNPADRPRSALALAAALPGGDPLAAALAAGETPSPELVAAAGDRMGLKPWIAWTCLVTVVVGLPIAIFGAGRVMLADQVPMEMPPDVLKAEAHEIVQGLGFTEPPAAVAHGFLYDGEYLEFLEREAPEEDWSDRLAARPAAVRYWYRQGPEELVLMNPLAGRISPDNPPPVVPGMTFVELDTTGRLLGLTRTPTDEDATKMATGPPDWASMFRLAGLEIDRFTKIDPVDAPPVYADDVRAWDGSLPDRPEMSVRVAAASLRGTPVHFRMTGSWSESDEPASGGISRTGVVAVVVSLGLLIAAGLIARRNLRQNRGDRKGAFRLATYVFTILFLSAQLNANHYASFDELGMLITSIAMALFGSMGIWIIYVALEPVVRRRWPDMLVSWTRLLAGGLRDPMVGRDLLLGAAFALALAFLDHLVGIAPTLFGRPVAYQTPPLFLGGRVAIANLLAALLPAVSLSSALLLVLFRAWFRRTWAAFLATLVILMLLTPGSLVQYGITALFWSIFLFLLLRFGMLAASVAVALHVPLAHGTMTSDLASWRADYTIGAMVLVAVVAIYGFWVSFAGRPLLGEHALED